MFFKKYLLTVVTLQLHQTNESASRFIKVLRRHYLLIEKGIEKMTVQVLLWVSSLPLFQQLEVQIYHLQRESTRLLNFAVHQFQIMICYLVKYQSFFLSRKFNEC
jgi:hypothetical protein